jgi:adenylate kinase family enzyme
MNKQTIIFIGRSGAGKGVQSDLLKKYFAEKTPDTHVLYIETGEYFRKHIKNEGYTWERARAVNEVGGLQPSFLAVWIWASVLMEKVKGNEHLIFDGVARYLGEAKMLHQALPFYERINPHVIFLDVAREWAEERLKGRGREDDLKPEVVAKRFAWYEEEVLPSINFYREVLPQGFLHINGEQTPEQVHADIMKGLKI